MFPLYSFTVHKYMYCIIQYLSKPITTLRGRQKVCCAVRLAFYTSFMLKRRILTCKIIFVFFFENTWHMFFLLASMHSQFAKVPEWANKVFLLKGSRQWESRGVRNVSNCPNLARTAAIEVRFSLNFAVVFDFIYFRFRPSKTNE